MKVRFIRTKSEQGYKAFKKEYLIRLYKSKNKELKNEYLEKRVKECIYGKGGVFNIWYDDFENLFTKQEIVEILNKENAEYEEIETDAISL